MRIITELNDEHLKFLAGLCKREKISRAEAIRRAVNSLKEREKRQRSFGGMFGLWKDRGIDGLEYQRRMRQEWPD